MSEKNLSNPMKKLICNFFKDDNIKPKDLNIGHVATVSEYLAKIAIHTLRLSTVEFEQSRHPKTIKFHQNVLSKIKVDSEGDNPFSNIGVGISIEYSDLSVDTEEILNDIRTYRDMYKFPKKDLQNLYDIGEAYNTEMELFIDSLPSINEDSVPDGY
jgi:hypothetical protein